jgi:hypothetical protein
MLAALFPNPGLVNSSDLVHCFLAGRPLYRNLFMSGWRFSILYITPPHIKVRLKSLFMISTIECYHYLDSDVLSCEGLFEGSTMRHASAASYPLKFRSRYVNRKSLSTIHATENVHAPRTKANFRLYFLKVLLLLLLLLIVQCT